ncbi:Integrase catalytic domain-containing protein [Abeliophyllum distichum]|uniref:Integrase catalytic domain-containing protein n=1 Tax=Abeliophyllum distichum TaxID=126358 RepID=A0ABD1TZ23_9LAMI
MLRVAYVIPGSILLRVFLAHERVDDGPEGFVMIYKATMQQGLATFAPILFVRAFYLTLLERVKIWYNKLVARSISSWPELKKTFIKCFSFGKPASVPVQRLHDIRQADFEPLQSYLSHFNKEMLFYERITNAKALSALKGVLDMNLPFWRDVCNKNPATFDQLVEMITEEITNENIVLHRNRG